ncbi:hypothetical protein LGN17_30015 [Burkholderia sp. AU30280]|uniref:hypothetical protein n=1 Tax=Burkholderia sp. AU30280 TaxID=2879628 RepID=UPI001CF15B29|nr:hypothetical protein [Burkholderia sp. AU30280]MCA8276721.1 hypothetical protein [Burkholderia sp. AU30280]
MHSYRNRLRERIILIESRVNFLFVENDLILALSPGNDGGVGQDFVFFPDDFPGALASKEERVGGACRSKMSLIFNCFHGIKKDCG